MKDGCAYFECGRCTFLFHRPEKRAGEETILKFYDQRYWEMERSEASRREQEDGFIRALELLYISSIPVENILDFGCGLGVTVGLLRQKLGLNAVGVDVSAEFEQSGHLHRCSLEEMQAKYPPGYFDAIYSIEVFEHLEDPKGTIGQLGKLLKPGGKILINTSTREFIAKHDPEQAYIDPLRRGHISIYSLSSLSKAAASIGYKAGFLGDHKYAVVLAPDGNAPFPNSLNLERTRRLGEWYPLFMREYMRLVFIKEEFEEKCAWVARLLEEIQSYKGEGEAGSRSRLWKKIWKYLKAK